tara:strand:- start:869 stop:1051 length:183 start_codon:yes stop_codon:yes gene_type:complete
MGIMNKNKTPKYHITQNGMHYSHSVLKTDNLTEDEAVISLSVVDWWWGDTDHKFEIKEIK